MSSLDRPKNKVLNPVQNDRDYVEILTAHSPHVRVTKTQILPGCRSRVPVGDIMQGILQRSICPGRSVEFKDVAMSTSTITSVRVTPEGAVFLQTDTSVYKLDVDRAARLRSLGYLRRGYLDYDEKMPDGFYDGGHSMGFELDDEERLSLSCTSSREVLLVDSNNDPALAFKLEVARQFIEDANTVQAKVQMLAVFVSNSLGGSQMIQGGGKRWLLELTHGDIEQRKMRAKNSGDIVMLGHLNYGVCRHRAIMFKYLADRLGIPSRLVRGQQYGVWHVWNVVQLGSKNYVVDVMQQPWRLMEENSKEVNDYRRVFSEKGRQAFGGIGGCSISG